MDLALGADTTGLGGAEGGRAHKDRRAGHPGHSYYTASPAHNARQGTTASARQTRIGDFAHLRAVSDRLKFIKKKMSDEHKSVMHKKKPAAAAPAEDEEMPQRVEAEEEEEEVNNNAGSDDEEDEEAEAGAGEPAKKREAPPRKKMSDVLTNERKELRAQNLKLYKFEAPAGAPSEERRNKINAYYADLGKRCPMTLTEIKKNAGLGLALVKSPTYGSPEEKNELTRRSSELLGGGGAAAKSAAGEGKKKSKSRPDRDLIQRQHCFVFVNRELKVDAIFIDVRVFPHLRPKSLGDKYENSNEPVLMLLSGAHLEDLAWVKDIIFAVPKKQWHAEFTGLVPQQVLYHTRTARGKKAAAAAGEAESVPEKPSPTTTTASVASTGTSVRSDRSKLVSAETAEKLIEMIAKETGGARQTAAEAELNGKIQRLASESQIDTSFAEKLVRALFATKPTEEEQKKSEAIVAKYLADSIKELDKTNPDLTDYVSLINAATTDKQPKDFGAAVRNTTSVRLMAVFAAAGALAYSKQLNARLHKDAQAESSAFGGRLTAQVEAFAKSSREAIRAAETDAMAIREKLRKTEEAHASVIAEKDKRIKALESVTDELRATINAHKAEINKLKAASGVASNGVKKRPNAEADDQLVDEGQSVAPTKVAKKPTVPTHVKPPAKGAVEPHEDPISDADQADDFAEKPVKKAAAPEKTVQKPVAQLKPAAKPLPPPPPAASQDDDEAEVWGE